MRDIWKYIFLMLMFLWVLWAAINLEMGRREWKKEEDINRELLKELEKLTSSADSLTVGIGASEFTQALIEIHLQLKPPELFASAGEYVRR